MSPGARTAIGIGAALVVAGIAVAVVMKRGGGMVPAHEPDDDGADDEGSDAPKGGGGMFQNQDKAIAVGEKTDPNVAPLLAEIRDLWRAKGIDLAIVDPVDFYVMSKAPHVDGPDPDDAKTAILAIASRATWDHTADFIADVLEPVIREFIRRGGKRSQIRIGGFREGYGSDGHGKGSYNAVTSGAKASRHVDGDAADILPTGGNGTVDKILMSIATVMLQNPNKPIGFGAYAGNGHVDTGGSRTWDGETVPGKAKKYLDRAAKDLQVA